MVQNWDILHKTKNIMKTILVPVNFTELSDHAIENAIMIGKQLLESKIIMLNVIQPAHPASFAASGDVTKMQGVTAEKYNVELMKKNQELIENKAAEYKSEFPEIYPYVRFNDKKERLNEYVDEFHVDYVVTGNHEHDSSFAEILFYNPTEKIIRKTDCPVITIKNEPNTTRIRDIAFAVDIAEEYYSGIEDVVRFAKTMNSQLHLLYIIDGKKVPTDSALGKLNSLAREYNIENYTINTHNNADVEEGILSFAGNKNCDMIALFSEGKGKLRKMIFGSTTDKVLRESRLPILIAKPGK